MTEQERDYGINEVPVFDNKAGIRGRIDFSQATWEGPDSVDGTGVPQVAQVEFEGATYYGMRNSAEPDGPILVFDQGEWDAFLAGARDGEFDPGYVPPSETDQGQ